MRKYISVLVILAICFCIPVAVHAQNEYTYYIVNYHPKAVEFEEGGNLYTIKAGEEITYTADHKWKSIRITSTDKTYRLEPGEGSIFYWDRLKKQIECDANTDKFFGYRKRIKATVVNKASQRVTVYWAGKREVLKPRYSKTITITTRFNQGLYIYQNGSVYAIPSGKHLMFWNDKLDKVSIDQNYYY